MYDIPVKCLNILTCANASHVLLYVLSSQILENEWFEIEGCGKTYALKFVLWQMGECGICPTVLARIQIDFTENSGLPSTGLLYRPPCALPPSTAHSHASGLQSCLQHPFPSAHSDLCSLQQNDITRAQSESWAGDTEGRTGWI